MPKELDKLRADFEEKAKRNLEKKFSETFNESLQDFFDEVMQEIDWQMADWFAESSYYPKPEDILVDYLDFSASEAHEFMPLFSHDFCEGKDFCSL